MPELHAEPREWLALVFAVLLFLYRAWILQWTWRDRGWVRAHRIGNGRRIIAEAQWRVQAIRLVADVLIAVLVTSALFSPDNPSPTTVALAARYGVVVLPLLLLLAAIGEARMRARLFREGLSVP